MWLLIHAGIKVKPYVTKMSHMTAHKGIGYAVGRVLLCPHRLRVREYSKDNDKKYRRLYSLLHIITWLAWLSLWWFLQCMKKSCIDSHTEQRTRSVSSGLFKQLGQVRSHAKNKVKAIHPPDGAVRPLKRNFINTIFFIAIVSCTFRSF